MISQETVQRIMDATRIEEVIGEFVHLRKRGANHVGCCPFHNEKTPSFSVSPSKGIYKCFGCGEKGNAVGFLMKHEHYTYPEALTWLARKYNIEIEEEQISEAQREQNNERDALYHVSEFAQKYFSSLLYEDEMGSAVGLSYFHSRGLTDNVIKAFGLGYCLDEWSAFTTYARKNGYSDNVLKKTGLTIFKDDGTSYDRFRGRVMFPIYSVSGRVLGFSGRVLSKEKQAAKYVNSPDSDIYNKGHVLYGLYQARNAIVRNDKCYLVEGNVDVISMFQSGVENAVASCGTSLTVEQARLMRRYTHNVTVLYDGDNAGIKAAFRAVNILLEEGLHVRVVLFPDGDDPDSYAQKYGATQLQHYLAENETNFVTFKTNVLADEVKNDPIKKVEALREIVKTIALVPDLMERTEYVSLCAQLLNMPEQTLQIELANELRRRLDDKKTNVRQDKEPNTDDVVATAGQESTQQSATETNAVVSEAEALINGKPTINPTELQEQKLVSLLLNYGNDTLLVETELESGKKQTVKASVAQVIIGDLLNENISFETPLLKRIFDECVTQVSGEAGKVDINHFVMHSDASIRDLAISLLIDDTAVSDQWKERYHIYVPKPSDNLRNDVIESLSCFKMKRVENKINEIDRQFAYAVNDEQRLTLVAEKMQYIKKRQIIGEKLNRVIV